MRLSKEAAAPPWRSNSSDGSGWSPDSSGLHDARLLLEDLPEHLPSDRALGLGAGGRDPPTDFGGPDVNVPTPPAHPATIARRSPEYMASFRVLNDESIGGYEGEVGQSRGGDQHAIGRGDPGRAGRRVLNSGTETVKCLIQIPGTWSTC